MHGSSAWEGSRRATCTGGPSSVASRLKLRKHSGRPENEKEPSTSLRRLCSYFTFTHTLQWDWEPQVRWIADAAVIMQGPVDWDQVRRLALLSNMSVARLARSLSSATISPLLSRRGGRRNWSAGLHRGSTTTTPSC
jgi:hypothetical protein